MRERERRERSLECTRRKGRVQCGGIEWSEKSNGVDLRRVVCVCVYERVSKDTRVSA